MNGIVLCEGNTDQILLSKYFGCKYGFCYASERYDGVMHNCQYKNEHNESLGIAYVEGKNKFAEALEAVLRINKLNTPEKVTDYIAVVMDHDSDEEVLCIRHDLEKILGSYCTKAKDTISKWSAWEQQMEFGEIKTLQFTLISIPVRENGALETFLLRALQDDEDNKYLAEQSDSFVNHLLDKKKNAAERFPKKVLQSRRLQIKAPLAVYFGIVNPERTFAKFEDVLESIDWIKYESINNSFREFEGVLG